jgi:signal transduction histidine kinase
MLARANLLTRLLILVAVGTVPAVLVLMYLQHDLRAGRRLALAEDTQRQAELLAGDLLNIVEGARQLTVAVSNAPMVVALDSDCSSYLMALRSDLPSYEAISVQDDDGRTICTTDPAGRDASNPRIAALARAALRAPGFEVGAFLPIPGRRSGALPFSLAFNGKNGRRGVIVAALSLDWLAAHLGEAKRTGDIVLTIADRAGVVLARFPDNERYVGRSIPAEQLPLLTQPRSGSMQITGADGAEQLIGFVPTGVPPEGLFIGVNVRLQDMLVDIDRATWHGTVLIVLGALLSLWLALLVGERFVRQPTAALIEAARRWSSGDLAARAELDETPASEFGRLAAAFNDMAGALGRQRDELQGLNAALELRADQRSRDLVESRNRLQVETAEREKTEAELRQAQKLQAVGQLAGGIAHDFNNLLTAITGALELLRRRLPGGQDGQARLVEHALRAAERGGRLTAQLLTFSRRQRLLPAPTDLNHTVQVLLGLFGGALGRSVVIETELAEGLWPAMVDPNQFEAALLNLCINARDAMPEGGTLRITTFNTSVPGELALGPAMTQGDYVAVRVQDNGGGMPADVLARVFEPFFTTKPPGRGSGLGLSQVHGLAVQSGGDVRVESRVRQGTTVTLLLPRAATAALDHQADDREAQRPGRRARVLVVDDDRAVREMTGEMLIERGHIVSLAADGAEGLAILARDLEENGGSIDILLADFIMPGMNGLALIRAARALRPDLQAMLVTGHAEFRATDEVRPEDVMRKPFTLAQLDVRIERMLAAREPAPLE